MLLLIFDHGISRFAFSIMASPPRRSARNRSNTKKAALAKLAKAKSTQAKAKSSKRLTRRRQLPSSTKQPSSSVAKKKPVPPKSPPVPRKKRITNPYTAKKKKLPPPPPPRPSPPQPDTPDSVIALPGAPPSITPFRLPTPSQSFDLDEEVATNTTTINLSAIPDVSTALVSIPPLVANNNGEIDFATVQPTTNGFTLHGILQSIANNPINFQPGTMKSIDVSSLSFNTQPYERKKALTVWDFFHVLANHSQAAPLAELIEDPDDPGTKRYRLFILTRAPPAPRKRKLLNWALLIYSLVHIKVRYRNMDLSKDPILYAQAQYEPNTAELHFKMLFAAFSKEHITYRQGEFTGEGK